MPDNVTSIDPPVSDEAIAEHSEQALIEMIYMKTANGVLEQALEQLEQALTLTADASDVLERIQRLHNQITVQSKGEFDFEYGGSSITDPDDLNDYSDAYNDAASDFYGKPIIPTVDLDAINQTYQSVGGYQGEIDSIKDELDRIISKLEDQTGGDAAADGTSLLSKLKIVRDSFPSDGDSLEDWILDKYDLQFDQDTAQSGAIQRDITSAITAAESLNDTQKESVRRELFVMEEYYKSAGSILTKISQLIEKMAQNISR